MEEPRAPQFLHCVHKQAHATIAKCIFGVFAFSITLVFGAFSSASQQVEEKNLFQRTGQQLSIFIMAPPDGFTEKLDSLNREIALLRPLSAGDEPVTADVWIFFVDEGKDIASLPGVAKQVFEATAAARKDDVLRYVEFTLGDGSKKAAVLLIARRYSDNFKASLPCVMAVDAFNAIYGGFSHGEFLRRRNSCIQSS